MHRPGEPEVVQVAADDAGMAQAMAEARRSFTRFAGRLEALRTTGAYYSVKVPLEVESGREHIWLSAPTVADGKVYGRLDNVPLSDRYEAGQQFSIPVESISDGRLYCGYTVLVARSCMSEAERAEFDSSVQFEVPAVAMPFE